MTIVCLIIFIQKKSQKILKQEIITALKIKKEYFNEKGE